MRRIAVVLASALLVLAATTVSAGPYSDTITLFKNAGESASFFGNSYAYAVFPSIGQGGIVAEG